MRWSLALYAPRIREIWEGWQHFGSKSTTVWRRSRREPSKKIKKKYTNITFKIRQKSNYKNTKIVSYFYFCCSSSGYDSIKIFLEISSGSRWTGKDQSVEVMRHSGNYFWYKSSLLLHQVLLMFVDTKNEI